MIKEDPDTHTKTPFIGDLLPVFFSLSVRANINGQALHEDIWMVLTQRHDFLLL
jgi:hypothetical protein